MKVSSSFKNFDFQILEERREKRAIFKTFGDFSFFSTFSFDILFICDTEFVVFQIEIEREKI